MSQINNVLTTTFRAAGGNVVSSLNSYAGGMRNLGGAINENSRMSERFNAQWRAIGTTIRYAIAGTAIFGLTRMVGQLRDVNNQLALMSAIGSQSNGQPFSFQQITQLGQDLQTVAVNSITPIKDVNDAAINLLSTVQNVPRSQLPGMLEEIAKGAQLAQTPIEALTQAATTMNIAFGRSNNLATTSQFTRMWFALIQSAPGGIAAAPTIAQSMPGLASMFQLAPGTVDSPKRRQAQMMALTLGVLRTGMPAATAMRGVTYLAQSIAQPTGGAKAALAGIGITPEFVHQHGTFPAIMKLLKFIGPQSRSTARRLGSLDDTALPDIGSSDPGANLPGVDASKLTALRTMIPRIHGIRAAIILASQLEQHGSVRSLDQNLQDMTAAENNHARGAQDMNKAWQRAQQRMRLQQATVAVNQMGLQVAQMFEPILNFVAGGPLGLSNLMRHHRHGAAIGGEILGGALGVAALSKFFTGHAIPGMGRLGGLGRFAGRAGGAAVLGKGFLTGDPGVLGASPGNPLFVYAVNDVFGGGRGPGFGPRGPKEPTPSGGGGGILGFVKRTAGWVGTGISGGYGLARGFPGLLARGGGLAAAGMAEIPGIVDTPMWWPGKMNPTTHDRNAGWENVLTMNLVNRRGMNYYSDLHKAQMMLSRSGSHITGISDVGQGMWHGRADVNLTITREYADGTKKNVRVHVPVDMWARGRHPGHRGQPKTVRTR